MSIWNRAKKHIYSTSGNGANGAFEELPKNGLIVYGAGAHLQDMLVWHKDLAKNISMVIDKDKSKIGKGVYGLSCRVVSPDVLKQLPAGTQVAISALRYYDEIVKELRALNPGLICPDIDQVYYGQGKEQGMMYGPDTEFKEMMPWCPEMKDRIARVFVKRRQKPLGGEIRSEDVKVSVIMPLYNDEIYLARTLESVVSQTLQDIEIIIVDDCSTDHSVDIVKEFMKWDGRIRLVQQEKNRGGGAARNTGMALAKGAYLSFLDSDDYFYPNMLDEAYQRIVDMGADICVYNVKYAVGRTPVMNFNKEYIPKQDVFSVKDIPTKVFEVFNAIPWNKMYRRGFVEGTGIHWSETFCSNDVFFVNSHLVLAEKITTLDKELVQYENRAMENSQSKYNWYFRDAMGTYIALRKELTKRGRFDDKIRASFISRVSSALNWQFESIDIEEKKEEHFSWLIREGFEQLGLREAEYEDYLVGDARSYNKYCNIQRMMSYPEDGFKEYSSSLVRDPINYQYLSVAYASNAGYAMPMSVSIVSLLENALPETFYDIFVLVSDVFPDQIKDDMKKSLAHYKGCHLTFVTIDSSQFERIRIYTKHLRMEAFFRLVMPNVFPYIDKMMYLDGDTIVCKDISELLSRNLSNHYVMGIKAAAYMVGDRFENRKQNELELPSMKQYINSGVMMMNLSRMRMDDMGAKMLALMKKNYRQEDQDVINKACFDNIRHLPLKYNAMIKYLAPDAADKVKGELVYAKDEIEDAIFEPVIIHYANKEKPWGDFDSFWADKWFYYAEKCSMFREEYYSLYDAYQAYKSLREFADKIRITHRRHSLPIGQGVESDRCKLTVIVPVYNKAKYLSDTLKSLIINLQMLGEAEAVIVDDCSSDNSLDMLASYASQYPFLRVYAQDDNLGSGAALNLGLSVARGEYVSFMDADDRFYSYDSLKRLYEQAKAVDADVCAGGLWECRENGRNVAEYHLPKGALFPEQGIVSFRDWQSGDGYQRFVFKRKFLEESGLRFRNIRRYQDVLFLLSALKKAGNFNAISEPVYVRRKHELQLQEEDMADLLQGMHAVFSFADKEKLDGLYLETCQKYHELSSYFPKIVMKSGKPAEVLKLHVRFLEELNDNMLEKLNLDNAEYSLQAMAKLYCHRVDLIKVLMEKGA